MSRRPRTSITEPMQAALEVAAQRSGESCSRIIATAIERELERRELWPPRNATRVAPVRRVSHSAT